MPMTFACDADIARTARGFLERSLPKAEWTHAAHFAVTLWLLRERGLPAVTENLPQWIRQYNESAGGVNTDTSGYHETITMASIRAAHAFLSVRHAGCPLHEVVNDLMASDLGRSDWLLHYWSKTRLFSRQARLAWLAPDLAPLPY